MNRWRQDLEHDAPAMIQTRQVPFGRFRRSDPAGTKSTAPSLARQSWPDCTGKVRAVRTVGATGSAAQGVAMRPAVALLFATVLFLAAPDPAGAGSQPPVTDPVSGPTASGPDVIAAGAGVDLVSDVTGYFTNDASGATYVPLAPARLLDTRSGNGLDGMFASGLPRSVQIAGRDPVPADAVAVTVNVTVTAQTSAGYVSVGPTMTSKPSTSTLNFPRGDNRANGTTVALDPDGRLAAVFKGKRGPDYPSWDSRYHNEWELLVAIRDIEIAHPEIVDVFQVGKSYYGRPIWAAKVSDNVQVDEAEPEVLFDALHHAREHLTIEQILYLFDQLASKYDTDAAIRDLVDGREVWFIFAVNPDGWAYDLGGSPYRGWRKNRQPNPGSTAVGTDINRNYDYRWGCCGGSSGNKSAWNYRGSSPFSARETRVVRDFVKSRVVGGVQQIRTHVTLHTNGELILYPYGYTYTDIPSDMTVDDHRTFVAMAGAMAKLNGFTAKQSSDLYKTDGDQIDWMYGRHGIFSFTFELYPTETVAKPTDHEPPDEVIAAQNARNRSALLYLIEMAACPYAAIGKTSKC
jgi:carboxypeptidase T